MKLVSNFKYMFNPIHDKITSVKPEAASKIWEYTWTYSFMISNSLLVIHRIIYDDIFD